MLAFTNRFHGHGSIRYVYANGQAVRGGNVTLKSVSNPRRKTPRVAVVISKKVLKSAVGRNRIRRRLYECIRLRLHQLQPAIDMVLIVGSADLRTMPTETLDELVDKLLREAGLYKTP